jgi:lipopolysaccharide assembly outer membrane protein LptD (OstA)
LGCFLKPALNKVAVAVVWAAMLLPAVAIAATPSMKSRAAGVPAPIRAAHEEPVNITGQETIYDSRTDTFVVKGDAVMTQGGTVLKADEIDIMRRERQAKAIGNVHLVDPEVEMWATDATVDITNETMVLNNAKILAKQNIYHLEGRQIIKQEGQTYVVKKGFFTTCGCEKGTPSWAINAEQMTVNMGHTGTAKKATFDVDGYPTIRTPYLIFPADTDRHSGVLSGRYGESNLRGFQWLQPYYLAINKSSDATVALDLETSQRVGGLAEYRLVNGKDDYLWMDGAFYNESLRSNKNRIDDTVDDQIADPHIPLSRYGIIAMARQHLTNDLIAYGDAVSVSDSLYLREMNVWTLSRGYWTNNFGSMRVAQSNFGLLDQFENAFVRLQGTWNQDLIQPQDFALQRLPDATVSGRQGLFNNLMFADYDAQAVNFYRYQGIDGLRMDANPRVTLPWRWGDYIQGYGQIGTQAAFYDTTGRNIKIIPVGTSPAPFSQPTCAGGGGQQLVFNNCAALSPFAADGSSARMVPYAKAGISTVLSRIYDVEWKSLDKLKNTIEPFANYYYVPNIYQGNQPLFDSFDRLNSRSLFNYGFTARLYAKTREVATPETPSEETPNEGLSEGDSATGPLHDEQPFQEAVLAHEGNIVRDGQRSSEVGTLTVQQDYDIGHQVADGSNWSDIDALMRIYASRVATFNSQVDYNPRSHAGVTFADVSVSYLPPWSTQGSKLYMGKALQGSFIQLGYNYANRRYTIFPSTNRNASNFISGAAYTEIFDRLGVYLAPSYDITSTKALSTEYGIRLKSPCDCWAADVGVTDSTNPNDVSVQFQVTLGGLGSIGQRPFGRNPFQQSGLIGAPTGVLPTY